MEKREKKKKSFLRRLLKWTGISFLLVLIALILIPIFFKDQIKELVLKEANNMLLADVSMEDFDLTIIKTFPNLSIKLYNTKITGRDKFKGVELVNIKELTANIGLWDVIGGDQIAIKAIHLEEPKIDVRILQDGMANYDIVKQDSLLTKEEVTEPSNFKMALQKYTITNGQINYADEMGDMHAKIFNLNHEGKGDLTADIVDFQTITSMDKFSVDMAGIGYLVDVKTDAKIDLKMEFKEKSSKFILKDNEIQVNAVKMSVNGFYAMEDGYDDMDLQLDSKKTSFKDLLSLIPAFYKSGYESMVTSGNLVLDGKVKGRMDATNMPGWDFKMKVANASIKYPDLPGKIENIAIDAASKFSGGSNLDLMTLDVDKFHANFAGNELDANLKMRNPMTDPFIDSKILAKVDLATLGKIMPLAEGENYTGKLDADVKLEGRVSTLEQGKYEEFKADGILSLMDMVYKSPDYSDPIDISKMVFKFSPKELVLESFDAKMGKSDFKLDGKIDNYIAYFFRDELLKGNFNFSSNTLDIDQLMGLAPSTESSTTTAPASTTAAEPVLIPANVDFDLNTNINTLKYNGIDIKNVNGNVVVKDEVANLSNLTMNAMGGKIGLKGSYDTKDHNKPAVDFGYDLQELNIQELAKNFVTIEKLAPIAKYTQGKISSVFSMKTFLKPDLEPIYSSLTGEGNLASSVIQISGFKPLEKIGEALNINKIKSQTINNFKTRFRFADGKVNTDKFDVKMGNIVSSVQGSTSFEQDIDYGIRMMIPKSEVPSSMLSAIEDQLKKVNGLTNVDLKLPDFIPVDVKVLGKINDPKVSTNFKEQILSLTGNLKDAMIDMVKDKINDAKDSVKSIVNNKVDEVKSDLLERKQKILDDAQVQANKVKASAKSAADVVRKEADNNAQKLIDEAGGNPIKKKVAETAATKVRKEGEVKAQKVESEGDQKADAIMQTARDKADQLK